MHPLDLEAPYWICFTCATERNGTYFKQQSTAALIQCGYCDGEKQKENEACFPVVDFKWNKKIKKY